MCPFLIEDPYSALITHWEETNTEVACMHKKPEVWGVHQRWRETFATAVPETRRKSFALDHNDDLWILFERYLAPRRHVLQYPVSCIRGQHAIDEYERLTDTIYSAIPCFHRPVVYVCRGPLPPVDRFSELRLAVGETSRPLAFLIIGGAWNWTFATLFESLGPYLIRVQDELDQIGPGGPG